MASFWDRVKAILGGQPSGGAPTPPSDLERQIEAILRRRMGNGELFEPIDVADEATSSVSGRTVSVITFACSVVERLYDEGRFAALGYARTKQADGNWVFHPKGADPARYTAPSPGAGGKTPAPAPTKGTTTKAPAPAPAPVKAPSPKVSAKDPLDAGAILGLSAEEMRKRALRIDPYRTAWIGRVDTIPPQSDERTALIDRGLILRGFLSEPQIAEIHKVGDLWLTPPRRREDREAIAATKAVEVAMADRKKEREAEEGAEEAGGRRPRRRPRRRGRASQAEDISISAPASPGFGDRRSHIEALQQSGPPRPLFARRRGPRHGPHDPQAALPLLPQRGQRAPPLRLLRGAQALRREAPPRRAQPRLAKAQAWLLDNVL
jgi:RNA-directed DNA polymerase